MPRVSRQKVRGAVEAFDAAGDLADPGGEGHGRLLVCDAGTALADAGPVPKIGAGSEAKLGADGRGVGFDGVGADGQLPGNGLGG